MAVLKFDVVLLDKAAGASTGVTGRSDAKVDVLEASTIGAIRWVKIRLANDPDPRPEGWVQRGIVDETEDVLTVTDEMIEQCVEEADKYGSNAFYLATVARLRSALLPADATHIGPLRFTSAEWMANLPIGPKYKTVFQDTEIGDWLAQIQLFAIMSREMQLRVAAELKAEPSMVQLLLAQTIGSTAAAAVVANPTAPPDPIIAAIVDADATAEGIDRANLAGRDKGLLAAATNEELLSGLAAKLTTEFEAVKPEVRKQVDKVVKAMMIAAGAPKEPIAFRFPSPHINTDDEKLMAEKITQKFGAAGYGPNQQVAALANAIGESGLDPKIPGDGGNSWGLFQLNQNGGVGSGYGTPELIDPDRNIEIMLAEIAKKYQEPARTAYILTPSFERAIEIFVHEFERPSDKPGDTVKRIAIAETFLTP